MFTPYYRMTDFDLNQWAQNFTLVVGLAPATYFLTVAQATDFSTKSEEFTNKLTAWLNPAMKTKIAATEKNTARAALIAVARVLVPIVNNNPGSTGAMRDLLMINARKPSSPIPVPAVSPALDLVSVNGRTATFRLHNEETGKPGKPRGVKGASVFIAYAPVAPEDPKQWISRGIVTRNKFEITFDEQTEAGMAFVSAYYFNERGQAGLGCLPVGISLPAAVEIPAVNALKIAA